MTAQSRRPNGRQLFWIPPPSPCHPVMGNVIGLFANRAQHGIVLVETFSVSQRVSTPFEGSHAQNIFAPNGLESFCPRIPQFAFLKAPTGVCGVWVDSCIGKWRIIRGPFCRFWSRCAVNQQRQRGPINYTPQLQKIQPIEGFQTFLQAFSIDLYVRKSKILIFQIVWEFLTCVLLYTYIQKRRYWERGNEILLEVGSSCQLDWHCLVPWAWSISVDKLNSSIYFWHKTLLLKHKSLRCLFPGQWF